MFQHFQEIGEEFPYFVELSQKDGGQLRAVCNDLMEEAAKVGSIKVRQSFPECFRGLIFRILGDY